MAEMTDGHILLPRFLLQFIVNPVYAAIDKIDDSTSGGSAELDMYAEVLDCIWKAFPNEDRVRWYRQWHDMYNFPQGVPDE